MVETIYESKQRARRDYHDDSGEYVRESLNYLEDKLTYEEKEDIRLAKLNNWRIIKGQMYVKQFNKIDGDTFTFRGSVAMSDICHKYDLYSED